MSQTVDRSPADPSPRHRLACRLASRLPTALSVLLIAGLAFFGASAQASQELEPSLQPVQADQELLEEVMIEGQVVTQTPRPKVTQYFGDALNNILHQFIEWLFGSVDLDETILKLVQWMIATLLVILALILIYQWIRWFRRQQEPPGAPKIIKLPPSPAASTDWRVELENRLERGEAAEALEALWWWLAERLGIQDADASWTTRELARRANRSGSGASAADLTPHVRRWDRLLYSGEKVDVASVRRLWQGLREALP